MSIQDMRSRALVASQPRTVLMLRRANRCLVHFPVDSAYLIVYIKELYITG